MIRNICRPRSVLHRRTSGIDRFSKYIKISTEIPSKQTDIAKILDIIKRKVLKGTHLPLPIKEIQTVYLTSPFFKDLYRYLSQNKLPSKRNAICKVEALSERFVLLDSLIFKIIPDKEKALLAIPEICVDRIITLYHASLVCRPPRHDKNISDNK